jgi:hypothetical protein
MLLDGNGIPQPPRSRRGNSGYIPHQWNLEVSMVECCQHTCQERPKSSCGGWVRQSNELTEDLGYSWVKESKYHHMPHVYPGLNMVTALIGNGRG